jgi:Predicted transcriptional regulators
MTGPAPECVALAEGLREARARTGLSLAALAERTAYSKSSWERYLNGKKPTPRQAVEALCALAGEPPGRLIALWELADAEWSGRASHTPAIPQSEPADAAGEVTGGGVIDSRARRRRPYALGAGAVALAAVAVMAAWSLRGQDAGPPTSPAPAALNPPAGCRGKTCEGKDAELMSCASSERSKVLGPRHRSRTGAYVQIRYSTACSAAWGRFWHTGSGDALEISAPGSSPQRARIADAGAARDYVYTPMIDASDLTGLRVCFDPAGTGATECFRP